MKASARRGGLALALVSLLLGSTISAASADTWRAPDPSGDVETYSFDPEPPPCGTLTEAVAPDDSTTDIVGLEAHHRKRTVELAAHFRDLTGWGNQVVSFALKTDRRTFTFDVRRDATGGPVTADVAHLLTGTAPTPSDGDCDSFTIMYGVGSCPGLGVRMSVGQDVVSVAIPRGCLDNPPWVRVGVRSRRSLGEASHSDRLVPTGADQAQFPGPFGPRLRRG